MHKYLTISLGAILFIFSNTVLAEENLFEKNFQRQSPKDFQSFAPKVDTKIMRGWEEKSDNIKMLEDGYDLLGFSGFSSPNLSPEVAREHGQKVKADMVLLYDRQINENTRASAIKKARDRVLAKQIKETKGNLTEIEITEEDLADSNSLYTFKATYWVKLPKPTFGTHFIKIGKGENQSEVAGALVIAVIKGSPAAKAGILKNDSIVMIDKVTVNTPEDLIKVIRKSKGKTVMVKYVRNGEQASVKVSL
ncbi:PDZ domain-containing protein [Methylophilaceae bacterium]|jgi:hypothetical protein|nr:PDZ domain-containing protein [Betaproteobacteria bacterium]MDA7751485.1 PDZ domain-containing protein [Methylophilaceae bacterium]MCH9841878.1 PDZ domain-containing protein [Betaproteobacteria bacterium]MDA9088049.1 PDZ domain-containing protein [Methylophilaceae bacterium]MDC0115597.1 PDZ domain-containing protein [Methylophilaceae bacterium]